MDLFARYRLSRKKLIETGLWLGDGVAAGLAAGFEEVFSCDIDTKLVTQSKIRFKYDPVFTACSDSVSFLKICLSHLQQETVVVFLDSHAMPIDEKREELGFGPTTLGRIPCPLMEELYVIREAKREDLVILVNDLQCFGTWVFDFLELKTVLNFCKSVNPNYKVEQFGNVLCFVP